MPVRSPTRSTRLRTTRTCGRSKPRIGRGRYMVRAWNSSYPRQALWWPPRWGLAAPNPETHPPRSPPPSRMAPPRLRPWLRPQGACRFTSTYARRTRSQRRRRARHGVQVGPPARAGLSHTLSGGSRTCRRRRNAALSTLCATRRRAGCASAPRRSSTWWPRQPSRRWRRRSKSRSFANTAFPRRRTGGRRARTSPGCNPFGVTQEKRKTQKMKRVAKKQKRLPIPPRRAHAVTFPSKKLRNVPRRSRVRPRKGSQGTDTAAGRWFPTLTSCTGAPWTWPSTGRARERSRCPVRV